MLNLHNDLLDSVHVCFLFASLPPIFDVVFSFGKNDNGQLGTNDKKTRMGATIINFIQGRKDQELNTSNNNGIDDKAILRFQQIEAGQAHSMFLSTNGFINHSSPVGWWYN